MAIYTYSEELSFAWDSWAQSEEILSVDGYFEFSVFNSSGVVCGLSPLGIPQHNASIAHGFFIEGLAYRVIEYGIPIGSQAAFSPSDRFRIERHGAQVLYFKNEVLLRETPVSYLGASRLYAAMYSYFDNVTDAVMVLTTSEAEADASLPAFEAKGFTDHFVSAAGSLPAYSGAASAADTSAAVSILPVLSAWASTDEVAYCISTLPALDSFSEQSVLSPDVTSSMSVLPGINSYSEAEDSPWLDDELPALGMVGLAVNEEDVDDDVAISFSELPAYSALADMAVEAWFEMRVPLPVIQQFKLAPTLQGKLFTLKGLLEGTAMFCEISGRLTRLRGDMTAGGLMDGQLALLQGKAFGSTGSMGEMAGQIATLQGSAQSGGLMDGQLPLLKGDMAGSVIAQGQIDGKVFSLKGSINAEPVHIGFITGRAFELKGSLSANQHALGQIGGRIAKLSGAIGGTVSEAATLSGKLTKLQGKMSGSEAAVGSMTVEVFRLYGAMQQTTFSGTHVTMKYSRR
jgi:hypothetical protein